MVEAAGPFLTEQFVPGISLLDGRLVFTMWGSAVRGDNWQCGVLLSDDGGHTLRYRQVGYELNPAIRKDPEVMAGFNEQTLFAAPDGEPFDNYYNAMNGTFVPLGDAQAMYVFGHFRRGSPAGHRAYAVHLRWE